MLFGKKARKKVSESFAGSENSSTFATANGKTPLRMALNGLRRVRLSKKIEKKFAQFKFWLYLCNAFGSKRKSGVRRKPRPRVSGVRSLKYLRSVTRKILTKCKRSKVTRDRASRQDSERQVK